METSGAWESSRSGSRACYNCGAAVPADDRFCSNCGQAVAAPAASTTAAAEPAWAPQPYAARPSAGPQYTAQPYAVPYAPRPDARARLRWATPLGLVVGAFAGPLSALSWVLPYAPGGDAAINDPSIGAGRVAALTATEVVFSVVCVIALFARGRSAADLVRTLRGGAAWLLAIGASALWVQLPNHLDSSGYWVGVLAGALMVGAGLLLPLGGWGTRPGGTFPVVPSVALVIALVEGEFLLRHFVPGEGSARSGTRRRWRSTS